MCLTPQLPANEASILAKLFGALSLAFDNGSVSAGFVVLLKLGNYIVHQSRTETVKNW